ncbi:methylmalonyl-CoA epimerase [Risungbinella massiliensis]|uniref:methylmalonyl-CoA epimerase n=1 Tax=Risungbinella massiliensis TaxID=1329796 RepID=UPI0005CBDCE6|nr:methylmalonyl-CoA epimerase [Risungbinella massiliensis]
MELKQIDHIGIAVHSLEESIPLYRDVLGLPLLSIEDVVSEQVRVAFFQIGEVRIELLEPLSEESAIAKHLATRGEGFHHIAYRVEKIERSLGTAQEKGIKLIHTNPKLGAHQAQIAFLHPKSTGKVLTELCQPAKKE